MSPVLFLPFQKSVEADGRRTLLDLARELGLPLQASCGGKKICGRCRIIIEESRGSLAPPTERERETLGELVDQGYRLACETVLSGEARVRIPEESQTRPAVILTSDGFGDFPVRLQPEVESYYLEVPSPVLERVTADRERLLKALEAGYGLKKVTVDPLVLPQLPRILRIQENKVTAAVRNGREVVGLFPGREERLLGLAVDIGTTTLVVYLLDLQTGERLAVSSALNPQVHFGDDVITRIAFCQKDPEGSVQLREAIRDGINDLIGRVVENAGVRPELIWKRPWWVIRPCIIFFWGWRPGIWPGPHTRRRSKKVCSSRPVTWGWPSTLPERCICCRSRPALSEATSSPASWPRGCTNPGGFDC